MQELLMEKLSNVIIKRVIFIILEIFDSSVDDIPICQQKLLRRFPSVSLTRSCIALFIWVPEKDMPPLFCLTATLNLLISRENPWITQKQLPYVYREIQWMLMSWKIRQNIKLVTFRLKTYFAYFSCRHSSQEVILKDL